MNTGHRKNASGFTLVELLAVIAIIGILAVLLFPAVRAAIVSGQAVAAGNDAKQIWLALHAEDLQRTIAGEPSVWPRTGDFPTSTEFFKMCITSNLLSKEFSFKPMAAAGVPAAVSRNPAMFDAHNNAWCVALDMNQDTMGETPFLFTRNMVSSDGGTVLTGVDALQNGVTPFGETIAVAVTYGGAVCRIRGSDAERGRLQKQFNPFGETNSFIRP